MSFGQQDNSSIRFSPKNPFDAIMYAYPFMFLVELKSTKGTSISFKSKTPMIKKKQIEELTKGAEYKGIIPGFIFNFRTSQKTYFLHINDFNRFILDTTKASINEKDIIAYGSIEIVGEIKKVKYKYYIAEFITKIQSEYE
jgi:penicillin-binding protein-related factor A (putative recombinase)